MNQRCFDTSSRRQALSCLNTMDHRDPEFSEPRQRSGFQSCEISASSPLIGSLPQGVPYYQKRVKQIQRTIGLWCTPATTIMHMVITSSQQQEVAKQEFAMIEVGKCSMSVSSVRNAKLETMVKEHRPQVLALRPPRIMTACLANSNRETRSTP